MEQITMNDYLEDRRKELEERYPIPEPTSRWMKEEGWYDTWHYSEIEKPEQDDVYYGIHEFKDCWIYSYVAWARGKWWEWDSWFKKWKPSRENIFAWVRIPSRYLQEDKSLHEMLGMNGIIDFGGWQA